MAPVTAMKSLGLCSTSDIIILTKNDIIYTQLQQEEKIFPMMSLSFESPVASFSTLVANLIVCFQILSKTSNFTCSIM